jgi:hypothetical protein
MRWMLVLLLLVGAALLANPQPAPAQAAVSAYPWCLEYWSQGAKRDCYYSTWEQCLYNARSFGGFACRVRITIDRSLAASLGQKP